MTWELRCAITDLYNKRKECKIHEDTELRIKIKPKLAALLKELLEYIKQVETDNKKQFKTIPLPGRTITHQPYEIHNGQIVVPDGDSKTTISPALYVHETVKDLLTAEVLCAKISSLQERGAIKLRNGRSSDEVFPLYGIYTENALGIYLKQLREHDPASIKAYERLLEPAKIQ